MLFGVLSWTDALPTHQTSHMAMSRQKASTDGEANRRSLNDVTDLRGTSTCKKSRGRILAMTSSHLCAKRTIDVHQAGPHPPTQG